MIFWGSPVIFVKTRLASWDEPLKLEDSSYDVRAVAQECA